MSGPIRDLGDFAALDPFFRIVEEGLAGLVDGGHFIRHRHVIPRSDGVRWRVRPA